MRSYDLMRDDGEDRPFGAPRPPFRVDRDGDIVDADGWLVCCPAQEVWRAGDANHAHSLCKMLNASSAHYNAD